MPEKKLSPRDYIINEIGTSEFTFLRDMVILSDYLKTLLKVESIPFIDRVVLEDFKVAIDGMVRSPVLKKDIRESNIKNKEEFLEQSFQNAADFYKNYFNAAKLFGSVDDIIKNNNINDKDFHAVLTNIEEKDKQQHILRDYTVKPVQRVCKYPLLLKELIEKNPKENTISLINLIRAKTKIDDEINISNRTLGIEKLIYQANNEIKNLLNVLRVKNADQKIILKVQGIFDDPNKGVVEKLSQITRISNIKGDLKPFKKAYRQLKKEFFEQLTEFKLKNQSEELDVKTMPNNKIKTSAMIHQYDNFLKRLKLEKEYWKQGVKKNNIQVLAAIDLIDTKIKRYSEMRRAVQLRADQFAKPLPLPPPHSNARLFVHPSSQRQDQKLRPITTSFRKIQKSSR